MKMAPLKVKREFPKTKMGVLLLSFINRQKIV